MDSARKAGWYWEESLNPGQKRYWDGSAWTERITEPETFGKNSLVWGIVIAALIIGAVAFGVLNLMTNVSRT